MNSQQESTTTSEPMDTITTDSRKMRQSRSVDEYKRMVQQHYDGLPGAMTALTGLVTGHEALAGSLIGPKAFDVRGCKRILDAACGNGRYSRFLLRNADPDAVLSAFDISPKMLERARNRVGSDRISYVTADLTHLPYADETFDAAICGWALEHLPDPTPALRELARVLAPGGRLLLLCTEHTLGGRICSRLWHCRTYRRDELRQACEKNGLFWTREHWFSRLHRWLGVGGIIVEVQKQPVAEDAGSVEG